MDLNKRVFYAKTIHRNTLKFFVKLLQEKQNKVFVRQSFARLPQAILPNPSWAKRANS